MGSTRCADAMIGMALGASGDPEAAALAEDPGIGEAIRAAASVDGALEACDVIGGTAPARVARGAAGRPGRGLQRRGLTRLTVSNRCPPGSRRTPGRPRVRDRRRAELRAVGDLPRALGSPRRTQIVSPQTRRDQPARAIVDRRLRRSVRHRSRVNSHWPSSDSTTDVAPYDRRSVARQHVDGSRCEAATADAAARCVAIRCRQRGTALSVMPSSASLWMRGCDGTIAPPTLARTKDADSRHHRARPEGAPPRPPRRRPAPRDGRRPRGRVRLRPPADHRRRRAGGMVPARRRSQVARALPRDVRPHGRRHAGDGRDHAGRGRVRRGPRRRRRRLRRGPHGAGAVHRARADPRRGPGGRSSRATRSGRRGPPPRAIRSSCARS